MTFLFYSAFLKEREKDLRRIANQTSGAVTIEDLESEAWLVADYIGTKRGCEVDWTSPEDQDRILGRLYTKHVTREKGNRRRTVSADQVREDHDGHATTLGALLAAEATSDPVEFLAKDEEKTKLEILLDTSYSQVTAYVLILFNLGNDLRAVCAYLIIADSTWHRRLRIAKGILKIQPSLFDCIERMDEDFTPQRGSQYVVKIDRHREAIQCGWEF